MPFSEPVNECPVCDGRCESLGRLGEREHYRCRDCGMNCSRVTGGDLMLMVPIRARNADSETSDDVVIVPPMINHELVALVKKLVICPKCYAGKYDNCLDDSMAVHKERWDAYQKFIWDTQ